MLFPDFITQREPGAEARRTERAMLLPVCLLCLLPPPSLPLLLLPLTLISKPSSAVVVGFRILSVVVDCAARNERSKELAAIQFGRGSCSAPR